MTKFLEIFHYHGPKFEKNWKKFHFKGPGQRHLGYVYAVLSKALRRKSFSLKILLAMLQMTRLFKILHYHGPKFEKKNLI